MTYGISLEAFILIWIFQALPLGHELFQLGIEDRKKDEEETAGEEIARSIQVADPRGRKHQCNFMISKIEQTVSQSERKFSKTTD